MAALVVALAAAPAAVTAGDASPVGASRPAVTVERGSPKVGPGMPAQDRWHLNLAFALALERVQVNGECGALFDDFGGDAVSILLRTVYEPVQTSTDRALCRPDVIAVTEVYGNRTRLCPSIRGLSRYRLATILIHEALHHAGMSEAPFDPQAPTAREITRMVKRSCEL